MHLNHTHLKDIINNLRKSDKQKIQLSIAINFVSSKGTDKECEMYSRSYNIEIMIFDKTDEIIEKFSESLLKRY